jgi:hypothetical protein
MTTDERRDFQRALLRAKLIRDDNLLAIVHGHNLTFIATLDAQHTYRVWLSGIYGEGFSLDRAAADALAKILMPEVES